jgi:hypothetical protein
VKRGGCSRNLANAPLIWFDRGFHSQCHGWPQSRSTKTMTQPESDEELATREIKGPPLAVANFGAARGKLIRAARATHGQACLYLKPLKFLK